MTAIYLAAIMTDSVGQYILPFHVVAAASSYLFFILCVIFCVGVSAGKLKRSELAVAFCSGGLFCAAVTLLTGSYWGYHAWGAAWVWEPRLTGMFLTTVFFAAWRVACSILGLEAVRQPKLTASLVVLGLPAIAFTHFAVKLFGGIHPSSVKGSGTMQVPGWLFVVAAVVILGLGLGIAWLDGHHWKKIKENDRIAKR